MTNNNPKQRNRVIEIYQINLLMSEILQRIRLETLRIYVVRDKSYTHRSNQTLLLIMLQIINLGPLNTYVDNKENFVRTRSSLDSIEEHRYSAVEVNQFIFSEQVHSVTVQP